MLAVNSSRPRRRRDARQRREPARLRGRSALLLGKAKDNNASGSIGPFIRLFDERFSLDDVRKCDVALHVRGPDGFEFTAESSMSQISRDPLELVEHAMGRHHQYPDGMMLFLGTMFAPTIDRFAPGQGFTHAVGDIVTVSTPALGALVNRVNHTDRIAPVDIRRGGAHEQPRATRPAGRSVKDFVTTMANRFQNYINGEWVPDPHGPPIAIRPISSDVIGEYALADKAQTNAAIDAAKRAFPAWSVGSIQERANILDKVGSDILARKDEIGRLLSREEGKTLPEGVGETVRAGHIFKFFAGEVLRLAGEKIPSVRPGVDVEITREPIGVIGLITPWNFPIAIPAWKIAPALAFGNTVVFKPAQWTPGCAWTLAEILANAGVPAGVFNLVMGSGSVVGDTIVNHPDVAAIELHRIDGDRAGRSRRRPSREWQSSSSRWAARIRSSCWTMRTCRRR